MENVTEWWGLFEELVETNAMGVSSSLLFALSISIFYNKIDRKSRKERIENLEKELKSCKKEVENKEGEYKELLNDNKRQGVVQSKAFTEENKRHIQSLFDKQQVDIIEACAEFVFVYMASLSSKDITERIKLLDCFPKNKKMILDELDKYDKGEYNLLSLITNCLQNPPNKRNQKE